MPRFARTSVVMALVLCMVMVTLAACSAGQVRKHLADIDTKIEQYDRIIVQATLVVDTLGPLVELAPESVTDEMRLSLELAHEVLATYTPMRAAYIAQRDKLRIDLAEKEDQDDATFDSILALIGGVTAVAGPIGLLIGRIIGVAQGVRKAAAPIAAARKADPTFDAKFNDENSKAVVAMKTTAASVLTPQLQDAIRAVNRERGVGGGAVADAA